MSSRVSDCQFLATPSPEILEIVPPVACIPFEDLSLDTELSEVRESTHLIHSTSWPTREFMSKQCERVSPIVASLAAYAAAYCDVRKLTSQQRGIKEAQYRLRRRARGVFRAIVPF